MQIFNQLIKPTSPKGSALLVVVTMMSALMFMGLFFMVYVNTERNNAAAFAAVTKEATDEANLGDDADIYMDWAMDQLLLGPKREQRHSALYGGQYSIIPNMIGKFNDLRQPTDLHPFSARGISIIFEDSNQDGIPDKPNIAKDDTQFGFDYTGDGVVDTDFRLNWSAAGGQGNAIAPNYHPDVDYTYPDINNMFLAHFSYVDIDSDKDDFSSTSNRNNTRNMKLVQIPSFFRPQYFNRDWSTLTDPFGLDATDGSRINAANSLRPHKLHVSTAGYSTTAGTAGYHTTNRYITANGTNVTTSTGTVSLNAFPFPTNYKMGVWTENPATAGNDLDYAALDVDNNGDDIKDGILMDLDYPVTEDPGNPGNFFVPMFSFLILDADGLANLNTAANINRLKTPFSGSRYGHYLETNNIHALSTYGNFLSTSNLGMSSSELNITRMLLADPSNTDFQYPAINPAAGTDLEQYQGMFSFSGNPLNNLQMANMEITRLLLGAPAYSGGMVTGSTVNPGRFGTDNNIDNTLTNDLLISSLANTGATNRYPSPGAVDFQRGVDDDDDFNDPTQTNDDNPLNPSVGFSGGAPYVDRNLNNLVIPWSVHPLDYVGMSSMYGDTAGTLSSSGFGKSFKVGQRPSDSKNPSRFFKYDQGWQDTGRTTDPTVSSYVVNNKLYGINNYYNAFGTTGSLLVSPYNWQVNEEDEVTVEPQLIDFENDNPFEIASMEELHFSGNDLIKPGVSNRLQTLLQYNFKHNPSAPSIKRQINSAIRQQFTTLSSDRLEFGLANNYSINTANLKRSWEFNDTTSSSHGNPRFPPRFAGAQPYSNNDPLRPLVRTLLTVENNKPVDNEILPQRKLNLNRILDIDPKTKQPIERRLTPHPVITSGSYDFSTGDYLMVHDNTPSVSSTHAYSKFSQISSDASVQEWWARYDRQRLARDIYVLLWILGGGNDLKNYSSNPYSPDAAKQMAQFAVNLVDSVDQDNVITKFVYDADLTDGWDSDLETKSSTDAEKGVVYGNELQELGLSEIMWVVTENDHSDDANNRATMFDDSTRDHQFLFIELKNLTPFDIKLNKGTYRIRTVQAGTQIGTCTFSDDGSPATVTAGTNFIVGTHDGEWTVTGGGANDGKTQAAAFRIDLNWDNSSDNSFDSKYYSIIPYKYDATVPSSNNDYPDPVCDFDLCHERDRTAKRFKEEASNSPSAAFGYLLPKTTDIQVSTNDEMAVVLERKINTQVADTISSDEWVEIDRFNVKASVRAQFDKNLSSTDANEIYDNTSGNGYLDNFISYSRNEPYYPYFGGTTGNGSSTNKLCRHSLGGNDLTANETPPVEIGSGTNTNSNIDSRLNQKNLSTSPDANNYMQPHFDRDLHSVMELLSIPLYGPGETSTADEANPNWNPLIASTSQSTLTTPKGLVNPNKNNKMDGHATAQFKFLNPDLTGITGAPSDADLLKNHWHRLLNFVRVDSSNQSSIVKDYTWKRTPGKINLNTIRNTGSHLNLSSLMALIDDDYHLDNNNFINTVDPHENGANPRDWAYQFLLSRDGYDQYWINKASPVSITLPGNPGCMPFRSLDYIDPVNPSLSLAHTLLRPNRYAYDGPYSGTGLLKENYNSSSPEGVKYDGNILHTDGTFNKRGLFEARTANDLNNNSIDYYSRNRLLSKIDNLTTNRSNVFYVWITVEFYNAVVDADGNTRIGDKTSGNPRRGFFVIDRTRLEDAFDPQTRTFDFKKFITYRRTLQ